VPNLPGWHYGGCRFSAVNDNAFPDSRRPLTPYLPVFRTNDTHEILWCCPADRGIGDATLGVGTGDRTAFRSYGTSYRANSAMLQPYSPAPDIVSADNAPAERLDTQEDLRGMMRSEITTAPSRLVLGGDAVWYEVAESTGSRADWHREKSAGNLLFLDGSVRFLTVKPKHIVGPVVFDPRMRGSARMDADPAAEPVDAPDAESVTKP
jgi:prepilin-type processing-associated H-X9-DG protein